MQKIAKLGAEYFKLRYGIDDGCKCIDWAVERLTHDEEGDDLEMVLLASAQGQDEVLPLVTIIVERYLASSQLDSQFLMGKYIVELRRDYLEGKETISSIDLKLTKLYPKLGYPNWLTMLSRNCEYAVDVSDFEEPFEQEFDYVSTLWASAANRTEFEQQYRPEISARHDVS